MHEPPKSEEIPEAPTDKVQIWLTAAVVSFIFGVVAFGFAAVWAFEKEGQEAVFRAQTFAPFGVAIAAIVTFFTVVWRGVLSTKQLELQADQLNQQINQLAQVIRQNDAKEDETLIRLLQDGAKFIAEDGKAPQVMAGVASLDALISNDSKRRYSIQAMDILANYYVQNYLTSNDTVRSARRALNRAAEAGVKSTVNAKFTNPSQKYSFWPLVRGFASQTYEGGEISASSLELVAPEVRSFKNVEFRRAKIPSNVYVKCIFAHCEIMSFEIDSLENNVFTNCNFSGSQFEDWFSTKNLGDFDLRDGDNFYYADDPPKHTVATDWKKVFNERQRPEPTELIDF